MNIDMTLLEKDTRGRKRSVTDEQVETMKKLRKEGYTVRSIAAAMGISHTTVTTYTKE
ncbi:helix-turn-helix domain-containing protein [Vibrio vulnificus]